MTTDTFPKGAGARCTIDGVECRIAGIAKGSGMIAPNMATMLAFVFTDAALSAPILKTLLRQETETSFNSITVDGDRSHQRLRAAVRHRPSQRAADRRRQGSRASPTSAARFAKCWRDLAIQIVRDGEGATKLVTVDVSRRGQRRARPRPSPARSAKARW